MKPVLSIRAEDMPRDAMQRLAAVNGTPAMRIVLAQIATEAFKNKARRYFAALT